jgi:ABC-type multidrug transport system, permease component
MHLFLYQLKLLLRNKIMFFWTLLFPLVLATLFHLAFSQLLDSEHFEIVDVAVIEVNKDEHFHTLLDELSTGDEQLLNVQYTSLEEAQSLLEDNKIDGYLVVDQDIEISIKENGIPQTILQTIVNQYYSSQNLFKNIYEYNPQAIIDGIFENLDMNQDYFLSQDSENTDVTVIYFYTLIGMNCLFAGFSAITLSTKMEGNLSRQGSRLTVSPTSKYKTLLTATIAVFLVHYTKMLVLFFYLVYGLNVHFSSQIPYILLLMAVGSFVGIEMGNCICSLLTKSEDTKISINTSLTMLCSFFAGMMIVDMKYLVLKYFPIGAYINPVSLITDAMYALYYYTTYERYFFNVFCLLAIGIILFTISIFMMRRKQYDSL